MHEDRFRKTTTLQKQLDKELDQSRVHFTSEMASRVLTQVQTAQRAGATRTQENPLPERPASKTASFWNREVRIPIPALVVPIFVIAALAGTVLRMPTISNPVAWQEMVVKLQSGIFTVNQFAKKE